MPALHGFILHAHTKPEKSDEFETFFSAHVAASRLEAGCIEYHMLRDQQDPTLFTFYEVWQTTGHLNVHSALPHMAGFFEKRMEFLTRDFDIRRVDMLSPSSAVR
ncbi:MAG TPA: putative quinol monooxygenase [Pseudomonas sp.]|uniref:putative quinol monooxygenase n=1 Tax=Pseudomonas sp. TaxID=306 RepID=UPI002ED9097A